MVILRLKKVTLTTLKRWKFPTNHQDSYLGSPKGHFETYKSYTNHIKTAEISH